MPKKRYAARPEACLQAASAGPIVRGDGRPPGPAPETRLMDENTSAPAREPLTPDQVFREYAPRIYNLARRMLGSDADAEDVTQDVLLQVVRKLDTFRGEAAFPTWLHRVTVNAALAHRRKHGARAEHES